MQPVSSSNVAAVGYDEETQTLQVQFHSGRTYRYMSVPQSEYENLLGARSVGQYFNENIKGTYAEA
jgi:hypothetical protein